MGGYVVILREVGFTCQATIISWIPSIRRLLVCMTAMGVFSTVESSIRGRLFVLVFLSCL
jgi:hypothetical protein